PRRAARRERLRVCQVGREELIAAVTVVDVRRAALGRELADDLRVADAGHEYRGLVETHGPDRGRVREGRLAVDHGAGHAKRACDRLLHELLEAELVVRERRGDAVHAMAGPERRGGCERAVEAAG